MGNQKIELAKSMLLTTLIIMPCQNKGRAHTPETESDSSWAKTVVPGKEHETDLQFHLHGVGTGEPPTVVQGVPAPGTNQSLGGFGYIAMFDDPVRIGPDPKSELVDRAQGLEGGVSREEASLITVLTCTFSDGIYDGSSLSILGLKLY